MEPRRLSPAGTCRWSVTVLSVAAAFCILQPGNAFSQQQANSNGATPSEVDVSPITKLLRSLTGSAKTERSKYRRTRYVIDLERPEKFEVFSLVRPNRVVLQIPAMRMRLPAVGDKVSGNLVTAVQSGAAGKGKTRIILRVATPVIIENAHVTPPQSGRSAQLKLDIVPVNPRKAEASGKNFNARTTSGLGAAGLQPPVPRAAVGLDERNQRTFKPVIVIDPGHGGHDSGAKKFGVLEKNAVLSVGKLVRDKLMATGRYRVLMTRDKDRFVTLGNRRRFAEKHRADLFISVHADYARRSGAQGATIYSLRQRVANRLKRSAKRQAATNVLKPTELRTIKATAGGGAGAVRNILADLAQRDVEATRHQTNAFTQTVILQMGKSTDMRSQPHRSAAFKVLKTATMPAVLIELAYVSNRRDARRLKSKAWRNKVSGSIASAVDNYFENADHRLPM